MKEPVRQPQLAELRFRYGTPVPIQEANELVQVGPSRKRQRYSGPRERWVYRPEIMRARGGLKARSKIAKLINGQTLDQIRDQAKAALQQLIYRALTGDKRALAIYLAMVKESVRMLPRLIEGQRKNVIAEAAKSPDWPVLLTRNPRQRNIEIKKLKSLKVGEKAVPRPGLHFNPRNLWTKLAIDAYEVCSDNARILPLFRAAFLTGATRRYKRDKFWGTKVKATFYYVPNGIELVIIADWASKCEGLREPITSKNFGAWWIAVKGCVWEYWHGHKPEYRKALRKIGRKGEDQYVKRNLAIIQVKQAFKTIVGLRSNRN